MSRVQILFQHEQPEQNMTLYAERQTDRQCFLSLSRLIKIVSDLLYTTDCYFRTLFLLLKLHNVEMR